MRRKDREMDEAFAWEVLRDCTYATLATVNADGTPYCIPIAIVLYGDCIYFHCAPEGKKLDNIYCRSAVCISGVRHERSVPEQFTTEYESAVATGICEKVSEETTVLQVLRALCEKYAASNINGFETAVAKHINRTCVYRIKITHITGKANYTK